MWLLVRYQTLKKRGANNFYEQGLIQLYKSFYLGNSVQSISKIGRSGSAPPGNVWHLQPHGLLLVAPENRSVKINSKFTWLYLLTTSYSHTSSTPPPPLPPLPTGLDPRRGGRGYVLLMSPYMLLPPTYDTRKLTLSPALLTDPNILWSCMLVQAIKLFHIIIIMWPNKIATQWMIGLST